MEGEGERGINRSCMSQDTSCSVLDILLGECLHVAFKVSQMSVKRLLWEPIIRTLVVIAS